MIKYDLRCERGHSFESWFQSSSAYDSQHKRRLVTCPTCGSAKVEKAIMAPRLAGTKKRSKTPEPATTESPSTASPAPLMMAQERELRAKLKELRDHVVKNADNVGEQFPNEARKCITATSSIDRSTAKPRPTRRNHWSRKASR